MNGSFPKGTAVEFDERGCVSTIVLDPRLYSEGVALKAAYWLTDRCHVHLRRNAEGHLLADIRLKDGGAGLELTAACGDYCNALVDFALRERVAADTQAIQEALLQRAFLQALPRATGG
ncbi:His-Xaa-Ser system protein HxsD [Rhodomicrobium lacus]|uniref:His-Xaa-Ser system protein HxsD n=1 Tax=Rhodomicrobium lacus TaxID=2498452 RepID=UPI000F8E9C38